MVQEARMTRLLGDTRKTPRANYDQGSIMLIRMVNFMHYSDITIRPLPGFNVLLGHNGSGKSAIVNAICIGLGGSIDTLQVLGTAIGVLVSSLHSEVGWFLAALSSS